METSAMALTDPYLAIVRRLTPAEKLAVAWRLRETAWQLAAAGIRMRQPGLSEDDVQARVREMFLRASA
jgi:hypothetical protein